MKLLGFLKRNTSALAAESNDVIKESKIATDWMPAFNVGHEKPVVFDEDGSIRTGLKSENYGGSFVSRFVQTPDREALSKLQIDPAGEATVSTGRVR